VISKSENKLLSSDNRGTSTNVGRKTIESLPTLSRSITDFTKLTPQSNGTSFAGQDNRLNNLSIDGSIFNNNFGLQALPGSQTNSTPISLDAIEEIQINVSPYSLRERDFTGAGINAITRSGTNDFSGSIFFNNRNQSLIGTKADTTKLKINDFNVNQFGFRLGGPIIKNKLFFFVNFEGERRNDPGVTFFANDANGVTDNNETRVSKADLDNLSSFLKDKFNYDAGKYQDYDLQTFSNKALAKIDWNINDKHKLSSRFSYLRSSREVPVSNSGTFARDVRRDDAFAMTFQNSNYLINNDIYSFVTELNSSLSSKISNNLILGYTANRDYREEKSSPFPLVDILQGGRSYITFGSEPFTPNNKLNTDNLQLQDNLSISLRKGHELTLGVNFDQFKFLNVFTPNIHGQYVFNNLNDFYLSANANLAGQLDTVKKARYVLGYSTLPDRGVWNAEFTANQIGGYIQDQWQVTDNFSLIYGVRVDAPFFSSKGLENDSVAKYNFKDSEQGDYKISTSKLPGLQVLINPRAGFNWDVRGNKSLVLRGGTGLFSGRPAFVWISNQLSNNGVQSGEIRIDNSSQYAFNPSVTANIPANVTAPAPSYAVAFTDPNFKYPRLWKGNLAVDAKLVWNIIGTVEFNASRGINDLNYINANLEAPKTTTFSGPDGRPVFPGMQNNGTLLAGTPYNNATRINDRVTSAVVLNNTSGSNAFNITAKLERPNIKGFAAMVAYNFAQAKDFISAGSIAFTSWSTNLTVNGNNRPDLAFSNNDQRHRFIFNVGYRKEFSKVFAFSVNLFGESRSQGRYSFVYSNDFNGDGIAGNDLIYIPTAEQVNFAQYTDNNGTTNTTADDITYTVQQQKDAFEKFVNSDSYLKSHRGQYMERNGGLLNRITRLDFSAMTEFFIKTGVEGGKQTRHTLQFRCDIFNIGNMIRSKWGVGDILNNTAILRYDKLDANGVPLYRMTTVNRSLDYAPTRKSAFISDVWQLQLGVRYYF
jgi:hypothetical protein